MFKARKVAGPEPDPPRPAADDQRASVAADIEARILWRRKWAVHRYVHLTAAFDEVSRRGPVGSMLAVGCGMGLAELHLAACHPEVSFTLTDINPARIDHIRQAIAKYELPNVATHPLDVLAEPGDERYDLVTSIEMLEHLDADGQAAAHLAARANRFVWTLVPACRPEHLDDPEKTQDLFERLGHVRPGYTPDTLPNLFPSLHVEWIRHAYYAPDAHNLRRLLMAGSDEELLEHRQRIFEFAAADVRDELWPDGGAAGIEILVGRP
jgi:SAM-dependent methyltransferase